MSNLASTLTESAAAVAALGGCQSEIDALDDASVIAGMELVAAHEKHVGAIKLMYATATTRRSSHELGYAGLARRSGSATPTMLIQSLTGASISEASQLAHLSEMVIEVENAAPREPLDGAAPAGEPETDERPKFATAAAWQAPIAAAVASGELSLYAANEIRRGLGVVDEAITSEQLLSVARALVELATAPDASRLAPEKLWRAARDARAALDYAAVERGAKERAALRYVRRWHRDGTSGGSWLLPDEEGGLELDTALSLMLANRIGGPRFPNAEQQGNGQAEDPSLAAGPIGEDTRTNEQVLADGFVQVFHNGLNVDETKLPGKQRAAVRVIVRQPSAPSNDVPPAFGRAVELAPTGMIEGSGNTLATPALTAWECEAGTIAIVIDDQGQVIALGREQRLFSPAQRIALAVRDGGCRAPGCTKPPSWTEAHHIRFWVRDHGKTDLADGILLCRFHHMLFHNNGWKITRRDGTYWLTPPRGIDPLQVPVEMRSKNPLLLRLDAVRALPALGPPG